MNKGRVLSPGKVERVRKVYCRKQKISIRAAARNAHYSGVSVFCTADFKEGIKEEALHKYKNGKIKSFSKT